MLAEMSLSGLGVIASAGLELHPGLTVLTGETGAGKTMVLTGLHLLSGARADPSRVRTDARRAVVEGRFVLSGSGGAAAGAVAEQAGGEPDEDGSFIATRTVGADGRSRAHLGGRSVPAGVLAEFTEPLLAVHGQNDQLRLQRPAEQRAALDRSAEATVGPLLARYRALRTQWQAAVTELTERTTRARELAREADQLTAALAEIDEVAPAPGEDAELAAAVRRLGDADALRETAEQARDALLGAEADESGGALALVAAARAQVQTSDDEALRVLAEQLDGAAAALADVGTELSGYLAELPTDPAALEGVLTRQATLKALTRKYAADADGVLAWAEQARERLGQVDTSAGAVAELTARRDALAADLAARHGFALDPTHLALSGRCAR
ncbi:DNA repair protein RecN, partial [Rhodococcus aerolatus]